MNEILELLREPLLTIVTLLLGYLGYKLKSYLNLKISIEKQQNIINIVDASVRFVEQTTGVNILSGDKLKLAKEYALRSLNDAHISITDEELTMWIEAIVNGFNQEKEEFEFTESVGTK